ncbi:MAG: hypothetical protein CL470_01390, partial [Acidimicrobiaceae bacterium]|nr:hypothetical protein [Acidimicrobiaceae bacterium]
EEAGFGGAVAAPVIRRYFEQIAYGIVPRYLSQAEADEVARRQAKELEQITTETEALSGSTTASSGERYE